MPVRVTGVTLDKSSISLTTAWDTEQLTATISPNNAEDTAVTWSSSDTSIATVSTSWLVTCVTPWTATITVTTHDWGYTATCWVTDQNWWQPWANTVAYFPLSSDLTDVISSNSLTGNCTYWTIWGSTINCAITTSNWLSWIWANLPQWDDARTVSMWFYFNGSNTNEWWCVTYGTAWTNNQVFATWSEVNNGAWKLWLSQRWSNSWYKYTWTTGSWYLVTMTYNTNHEWKLYINWTYIGVWNKAIWTAGNDILLWGLIWNTWDYLYWGFSNLIIENVERTSQEISDYYDLTKLDYWIS